MPSINVTTSFAGDSSGTAALEWAISGPGVSVNSGNPQGWSVSPRYTRSPTMTQTVSYPADAPAGNYQLTAFSTSSTSECGGCCCCGQPGPIYAEGYASFAIEIQHCVRWICNNGTCTQIGDISCDEGYETEQECEAACEEDPEEPDCTLTVTLSGPHYVSIDENCAVYWTAVPSGGAGSETYDFGASTPGGVSFGGLSAWKFSAAPGTNFGAIGVSVTVTDANGCTATASASLPNFGCPAVTPPPNAFCVDHAGNELFQGEYLLSGDEWGGAPYWEKADGFALLYRSGGAWRLGTILGENLEGVGYIHITTSDLPETGTYAVLDDPESLGEAPAAVVSAGNCAAVTYPRWVCLSGVPTEVQSEDPNLGYATQAACLADGCGAPPSPECTLAAHLTYARTTGTAFRVTAHITGQTGTPTVAFSIPSAPIANETATTALVSVAANATLLVTATITDGPCSLTRTVTVDGNTESGSSECTLDVTLALLDLGDGDYRVGATLNGAASSSPAVLFYVDGTLTSADAGPGHFVTVNVPYGDSKVVIATASDGPCLRGEALTITNGDGIPPENSGDGDCVANLGVYFRDIEANVQTPDAVIWNARIGLEVQPPCSNPACQYWWQLFDSSDAALFQDYSEAALEKHFPIPLGFGASYEAQGQRPGRSQILASAISRPATTHKHVRIKATPVYQQKLFALTGDLVKIRDLEERSLFLFETGPARVRRWTAPPVGEFGAGTLELLVNLTDLDAADATDAALLGDKIYVVAPGEVFVIDTNEGDQTLHSGVRGESRTPRFVEVVGDKPLVIYTDAAAAQKSRCYDLSFPAPKLAWETDDLITATMEADGKLLLAAGAKLLSSAGGTGAPELLHTFADPITALADGYVALDSGQIWKKQSGGWANVHPLPGPGGALWPWLGGAQPPRALAGAASGAGAGQLVAEQPTLNWANDITLSGATGIRSMRALSAEVEPATETQPAIEEEWMLIGDDANQLWVYHRTPLSEKDGAFKACHVAVPRLFPLLRRKSPETAPGES